MVFYYEERLKNYSIHLILLVVLPVDLISIWEKAWQLPLDILTRNQMFITTPYLEKICWPLLFAKLLKFLIERFSMMLYFN
jgi:hypothetical protein